MPEVSRFYPSLRTALVMVTLTLVGHAAETPAPPQTLGGPIAAPPPATAAILGRVVDVATGRPLGGVVVRMIGGTRIPGVPPSLPLVPIMPAVSDGQGQFVFRGLAAGRYTLNAQLGGYLPGSYGQTRVDGPSAAIPLTNDERLTNVTIRMWKHGAISGRVLDEAGEPAVGWTVRLLRRSLAGQLVQWAPAGTNTTDDRGVYRLGSIQPGEYVLATTAALATVPASVNEAFQQAMQAGGADTAALQPVFQEAATTPYGQGTRIGGLLVQPLRNTLPPPPTSVDEVLAYQTVYHPSAVRLADATRVRVASGEEKLGVDLQARLVKTFRVSGQIIGPDGQPLSAGLQLFDGDASQLSSELNFETAGAIAGADGRFVFLGVPAGQYTIRMIRSPRLAVTPSDMVMVRTAGGGGIGFSTGMADLPPPPPPDDPTLWAEVPVAVAGHVDNVVVGVRPGARVRGTVVFDGQGPVPQGRPRQQMGFTLAPVTGRTALRLPAAGRLVTEDSFVTTQYPPGRYFFTVTPPGLMPQGGVPWTVRSVMVSGRNALEEPFELGTSDLSGVVVTLTTRTTELSGTVRSTTGAPSSHATVVVFPADYERWIATGMRATRARTLATGADGSFEVSGLLPGDYRAVALPPEAPADLQDAAAIPALARAGTSVTLVGGETRTITLTASPARGGQP